MILDVGCGREHDGSLPPQRSIATVPAPNRDFSPEPSA
jgi:hypothetical protein